MNNCNVLVTGGAGFIGSHLVDCLLSEGIAVTVIDNFDGFYGPDEKELNIRNHTRQERYCLLRADIRDLTALRKSLNGQYDCIVHLAAKAGVRPSIQDPLTYNDVNVRGTQNLLEMAREWGVKQFVFASSSSVYGVNPSVPWREDDHVLLPISPYASTKVSGELLGHVYSHLYDIRFLALRFFTVYGPRQRPDLAIHKFATLMRAGMPVPVFGDGTTRRDYTFVSDIVRGIRSAIDYRGSSFEVINLGNNRTVTTLAMIRALEAELQVSAQLEFHQNQPGDVSQTDADISKAKAMLGYEPRTHFESGIKEFVDWFDARQPHLTRDSQPSAVRSLEWA